MLDSGKLVADGTTHKIVAKYMHEGYGTVSERSWHDTEKIPGGEIARLRHIRIKNESGETSDSIDIRTPVGIEMTFELIQGDHIMLPNFHLVNEDGVRVFTTIDVDPKWRKKQRPKGTYTVTAWVPGNFLSEGNYFINAALVTLAPRMKEFFERDVVGFNVFDSMEGDSARGDWATGISGVIRPLLRWETDYCKT